MNLSKNEFSCEFIHDAWKVDYQQNDTRSVIKRDEKNTRNQCNYNDYWLFKTFIQKKYV